MPNVTTTAVGPTGELLPQNDLDVLCSADWHSSALRDLARSHVEIGVQVGPL